MSKKVCYRCGDPKDESCFSKNKAKKDGLSIWCKECFEEYRGGYYLANRKDERERNTQYKRGIREWFEEYKSHFQCEECPEDHPATLDFHHKDGGTKESNVAFLVVQGYSKERILAEIAKCRVLCSNCHRKLHYAERRMPRSSTG